MLICNRRDNDTLVDPLGTIRTLQTGDSVDHLHWAHCLQNQRQRAVSQCYKRGKFRENFVTSSEHVNARCEGSAPHGQLPSNHSSMELGKLGYIVWIDWTLPTIGHPHSLLCLCGQFSHVWTSIKATGECSFTKKRRWTIACKVIISNYHTVLCLSGIIRKNAGSDDKEILLLGTILVFVLQL